jgi:hypothetical protein
MAKGHIWNNEDGSLLHFARHTSACKHPAGEGCNYSKRELAPEKTDGEPYTEIGGFKHQNHHLLPTGCLDRFEVWKAYEGYVETIQDLYRVTAWCASSNKNMIALSNSARKSRLAKLPKHNRDHWCVGGYNDEVIIDLHSKIWIKAQKTKDKPNCQKREAPAIQEELGKLERKYRKALITRGKLPNVSMAARVLSKEELVAELKKNDHWAGVESPSDLWEKGVAKQ